MRAPAMARLIAEHAWPIDPANPAELVLLPEMDGTHDVPGNHHALLGHPEQEPRRHDVRVEPHGGQAPGRGSARRWSPARSFPTIRPSRWDRRWREPRTPTAACSPPAP